MEAGELRVEPSKYDGVNPLSKLHPGEPWFFIRSQDRFSIPAVRGYAQGLHHAAVDAEARGDLERGLHLRREAESVLRMVSAMNEWQENNADLVKDPD